MTKSYSFPPNQITPEVFEDFKEIIWDPSYTVFSLKNLPKHLFSILLKALVNREVPIAKLKLSKLDTVQKQKFFSVLSGNGCKLISLNLSDNAINPDEAKILARALQSPYSTIKILSLHANDIADKGTSALAIALKCRNCKVEELDLSFNGIEGMGIIGLASACMNDHCEIKCLDISNNPCITEDRAIKALALAMRRPNSRIMALRINGSPLPPSDISRAIKMNPNMMYFNGICTQHYESARLLANKIKQGEPLSTEDIRGFGSRSKAIHWLLEIEDDDTSVSDYVQLFIALRAYLDFLKAQRDIGHRDGMESLHSSVESGSQSNAWEMLEERKRAYQDFFGSLPLWHQNILSGLEDKCLFHLKRDLRRSVSVLPVDVLFCVPEVFSDSTKSQKTLGLFFSKNQSALANILEHIRLSDQNLRNLLIALTLQASGLKEIAFEDAKRMIKQTFCVIRLLLSAEQQEYYKNAFQFTVSSQDPEGLDCIFKGAIRCVNDGVLDPAQRRFVFYLGDDEILSWPNLGYGESYDPHAAQLSECRDSLSSFEDMDRVTSRLTQTIDSLLDSQSSAEQAVLSQEQEPEGPGCVVERSMMLYAAGNKRSSSTLLADPAYERALKRRGMTF